MGLLLANGNYLKVTNVDPLAKSVMVDRYKTQDIRLAWKAGTADPDFDRPVPERIYVAENMDNQLTKLADATVSIQDNINRAGYKALKKLVRFADATDVL